MKTKAAVLLGPGEPFKIMELELDPPGPGEVLIKYTLSLIHISEPTRH